MYLNSIFKNGPCIDIKQLSCDSRIPMKDCIFFCINGVKYNGHDYVNEAIAHGASVIVYSDNLIVNDKAIFIKVKSVENTLIKVCKVFYNDPCSKLETYVVSGNLGRSSVSKIINHALSKKKRCASIGIFGVDNDGSIEDYKQATLPILDNFIHFDEFVKKGCEVCTLEASAISLSYKKLDMLNPKAFIYTTTSQETTDYKELGKDYYNVLNDYMSSLDANCKVVLNYDDPSFEVLSSYAKNKVTYGMNKGADYYISEVKLSKDATSFVLTYKEDYLVNTKLLGLVNVYNVAAALTTLHSLGYSMDEMIFNIRDLDSIDGVMERLNFTDYNVYVDCAYTLDSYSRAFKFARKITTKKNKVLSLISINSTDTSSRLKLLARQADKFSDFIILTSDDSYEGDLTELFNEATSYIKEHNNLVIEDREGAIEEAVELLNVNDTLLVLGKGNENFVYQGLVKKKYSGDKNLTYKYMKKRQKEEVSSI